jgi:hypothetical protein
MLIRFFMPIAFVDEPKITGTILRTRSGCKALVRLPRR